MGDESVGSNIKINNFGIIKDADIEISPLTVFIGSNSCGKSFIAKLIHSLSMNSEDNISQMGMDYFTGSFKKSTKNDSVQIQSVVDKINEYIKTNPTLESKPLIIPIKEIDDIIDNGIKIYVSEIISDMINGQFEEELDDLINFNEESFKINIGNNELYYKSNDKLMFNFDKNASKLIDNTNNLIKVKFNDDNFIFNINSLLFDKSNLNDSYVFSLFYQSVCDLIIKNLFFDNSYYIPAERSEIITDNKLLTRKIQNKSDVSKNQSEVMANILNIKTSKKSIFYDLGCELEDKFSDIRVDIDESQIFNNIVYNKKDIDKKIPSKLISTSIHEISILILYLKYVLKKGDLVIIEEPEAHLHPKNQIILIQYLIRAINQGLKVMFTTHSDFIVNQINNFITLNNVSKRDLSLLGYDSQDILDFHNVNIYNFKMNENNTFNSQKIEINEYGFVEDNFSKISTELYDETIDIDNLSVR